MEQNSGSATVWMVDGEYFELTYQWNGGEAKCSKEDRESLGLRHRTCKHNHRFAGKLVDQMDEICILVFMWYEEVVLHQGCDCCVFGCDAHADRVFERGSLK